MAALGTTQTVLVCVLGTGVQGVCPDGYTQSVTSAYLIAPSESSFFDSIAEPFDVSIAGSFFGYAFATTIFVYLLALGVGTLISLIKES